MAHLDIVAFGAARAGGLAPEEAKDGEQADLASRGGGLEDSLLVGVEVIGAGQVQGDAAGGEGEAEDCAEDGAERVGVGHWLIPSEEHRA